MSRKEDRQHQRDELDAEIGKEPHLAEFSWPARQDIREQRDADGTAEKNESYGHGHGRRTLCKKSTIKTALTSLT